MNWRHTAAVLLALGFAGGCSVVGLSPEQEEEAYLLRVAQAEAPWLSAISRFDNTLTGNYSTRTAFFVAINEAGLEEGARDSLEAAAELTPPDTLADDHGHWLALRGAATELAPELTQAAAVGDVLNVLAVRRGFGKAEAEFLLSIGREFCIHLDAVDPAEDCPPDDSLPGGGYGTAAYEALREYAIRIGPLFLTSAGLDQGQRTQYLASVQPEIEELLLGTGDRLGELDPPTEFATDHEALLRYFDDQYAVAALITDANAIGDDATILELYAESARLFDDLQNTLSDAVRPIVNPAF